MEEIEGIVRDAVRLAFASMMRENITPLELAKIESRAYAGHVTDQVLRWLA